MTESSCTPIPLGSVLEHALRWGLPFAPFFAGIIQVLIHTLTRSTSEESFLFSGVCILGIILGCAVCFLPSFETDRRARGLCLASSIIWEISWIMFFLDQTHRDAPTAIAMFLFGLSSAPLLVLWLKLSHFDDTRCQITVFSAALLGAFLLHMLLGLAIPLEFISFFYAPWICLAVLWGLKNQTTAPSAKKTVHQKPSPAIRLPMCLLGLILGAAITSLGFGDFHIEYAFGLAGIVLAISLTLPSTLPPIDFLRSLITLLAIVSLCAIALLHNPQPFIGAAVSIMIYLAVWLFDAWASESSRPITLRCNARAVLACTTSIAAGLAGAHAIDRIILIPETSTCVLLISVIALGEFLRQLATVSQGSSIGSKRPQIPAATLEAFSRVYGLSPREEEVARLLCEDRSVDSICSSLDLAKGTVKTHIRHIYDKTGNHNRLDLQDAVMAYGNENGKEPRF